MVLKYILTPIMGTIIGYGTNYIAVKMLFYPKHEIKLWGHTLPFTPGAIPKGKPRLAKAIGNVVGSTLVTKDDIKSRLMSESTQKSVTDKISELMSVEIKQGVMSLAKLDEDAYEAAKAKMSDIICGQILDSLDSIGVSEIIADECGRVVKEKTNGTMLKMFLTDELIASITKLIGDEVQKYIDKNGETLIGNEVNKKLSDSENKSVAEILESIGVQQEKIDAAVSSVYQKAVDRALDKLFDNLNISDMIEEKINEMDMDELEKLTLSVMKKELETIVNLGAVIGLLLGLLNTLFMALM